MWIFQNNSFLSIVAEFSNEPRKQPKRTGRLLVRSRIAGDIERAIPGAVVFEGVGSDYRYRSFVTTDQLKAAVSKSIDGIDYRNFKDSISKKDEKRHHAYMSVWSVMANAFGAYLGRRRPAPMAFPDEDPDVEQFLNGDADIERVFPGTFGRGR